MAAACASARGLHAHGRAVQRFAEHAGAAPARRRTRWRAAIHYLPPSEAYEMILGGTNLTDDRYLTTGSINLAAGENVGHLQPPEGVVPHGSRELRRRQLSEVFLASAR